MINIGQYIETVINWMMVHFSTFFDAINAGIGSFIIGFQHVLFGMKRYCAFKPLNSTGRPIPLLIGYSAIHYLLKEE